MKTVTKLADGLTPVRAFAALRDAAGGEASFLFESVVGGDRWGRYGILGTRPSWSAVLREVDGIVAWELEGATGDLRERLGDPKDVTGFAERLFAPRSPRGDTTVAETFARATFGFVAWDLIHATERVPAWERKNGVPLARFVGGATVVVFDAFAQTFTVAGGADEDVSRVVGVLSSAGALRPLDVPERGRWPDDVTVGTSDDAYVAKVRAAKEFIRAGDAFQIVLARPFTVPARGRDAFDVYRAMRAINPSPYMYFVDFPPLVGETTRTEIAGASPETLVRLDAGTMTVRPIAGTRKRGANAEEDATLERELLADPKELSEHVMLIDLGRNDVGRVSETGTVRLDKRMVVEKYSHVMHIVSEVSGTVGASRSPFAVLRSAFPAGTLSGAPKLRAMQIVRELEDEPRGIYGGAIGYVTDHGDLDFAIAIRTAVLRDGVFRVTAGAGIVEASDERAEAEETRSKARGVLAAIAAVPTRTDH
ncbi:MAG: anthranilate synthase component I family protein [Polyangiaceae bacterium]